MNNTKESVSKFERDVREAESIGLTANEFCYKYGYSTQRLYKFRERNTTTLTNKVDGKQVRNRVDYQEIRALIGKGKTEKEISVLLSCSPNVVQKVKQRIKDGIPCPIQKQSSKDFMGAIKVESAPVHKLKTKANKFLMSAW